MGKEILWWRFHSHAQKSYIKGHCWGRANRIPGWVHEAFCILYTQRSRVLGSATLFVLWPRLCWGNVMPAIAIKCSICPKIIFFRGVIHCSMWEPGVREDKISPIYSVFSPHHPHSRIKLELAVWLMTQGSSQSTSALCRASQKYLVQTE